MITAQEFLKENRVFINMDISVVDDQSFIRQCMIEFAKYHVQEALRQAVTEVEFVDNDPDTHMINGNSILNAYPLTNVK